MKSFLLLYVFHHCTGILQQLANLSNHPVGNSHSVAEMFLSLDWFFQFAHLFRDGMLLIVVSLFPVLLWVPPWISMQIVVLCHLRFSWIFHTVFRCHLYRFLLFLLIRYLWLLPLVKIFVNQLMITIIASIPFNFGRGPMISMLISCYGSWGISNECSSSAFLWWWTLFC